MVNVHLRYSSEMFSREFDEFTAFSRSAAIPPVQPALISPILRGIADKGCKMMRLLTRARESIGRSGN